MFTDSAVAASILHIPFLPLTVVVKNAFVVPIIAVSVLLASLTGKQNDKGTVSRCGDATLHLTTK